MVLTLCEGKFKLCDFIIQELWAQPWLSRGQGKREGEKKFVKGSHWTFNWKSNMTWKVALRGKGIILTFLFLCNDGVIWLPYIWWMPIAMALIETSNKVMLQRCSWENLGTSVSLYEEHKGLNQQMVMSYQVRVHSLNRHKFWNKQRQFCIQIPP